MKKTLTLISLGLLALTGNAFADSDNYTSYNGTGCDNYYSSEYGQFNHQYDGITNISSSARWVSCPVNKDNVSGLGGQHTWVRWSGSGTVTCYINNFNINGARTEYKLASGGPGWISLPNLGSDDFWGTYTLYCLLPARATLQTYHVLEF